jgi:hypothetical protein
MGATGISWITVGVPPSATNRCAVHAAGPRNRPVLVTPKADHRAIVLNRVIDLSVWEPLTSTDSMPVLMRLQITARPPACAFALAAAQARAETTALVTSGNS